MQLPATMQRVEQSSPDSANDRIRRQTEINVRSYAALGDAAIARRLDELEREWDIERTLETNAAAIAFTGVALGAAVNKRFLVIPAIVTGFLLQHALQGWCPPVPFFRAAGVRTAREIDEERMALKALRGDFDGVASSSDNDQLRAHRALTAARM